MSKNTQCLRILEYLENHEGITQFEALQKLGVMRLASRISDMRKSGHKITSRMIDVKNRYGETCKVKRYSLQKGDCS